MYVQVMALAAAIVGLLASCASPTERPEDLMNVTLKSNIYSIPAYAQTDPQFACAASLNPAVMSIRQRPIYDYCRQVLERPYKICADIYDKVGRQWVTDMTNAEVRVRGAEKFCGNWYVIRK